MCSFQHKWFKEKDYKTLYCGTKKTKAQWGICNVSLNIASINDASLKVHMKTEKYGKNKKYHRAETFSENC